MIVKLKVSKRKGSPQRILSIWIQKHRDFNKDIDQLLEFFKQNVKVTTVRRLRIYYKITSEQPAIMLSLFSSTTDLIQEVFFKVEDSLESEDMMKTLA